MFDENGLVTTVSNDLGSPFQTGGILFGADAPAYILQGDTIRITDTIRNESAFLQTIDMDVIIRKDWSSDTDPLIDTGSAGIVLNGSLSSHSTATWTDNISHRLAKVGSGTLFLNAENTFRGREAFIYEGTVQMGHAYAIAGVDSWLVRISDGAALTFASGVPDSTFYIPGLTMLEGSILVLEDTDGDPIHLVLTRDRGRSSGIRGISGSGSLTIDTGPNDTHTVFSALTHTGGTFVRGGTLALNSSSSTAFGTGDIEIHEGGILRLGLTNVTLSTDIHINGGGLNRPQHQNHILNFGTSGQVLSLIDEGIVTGAEVLAGTNNGDSGTIETFFSFVGTPTAAAANDSRRLSDVFTVDNPGANRTFVLQLSTASLNTASYLAIFNPMTETWVEAVESNFFFGDPAALAGYYEMSWDEFLDEYGSFNATTMLGAHGYDADGDGVWAVLNYGANEPWSTDFGDFDELELAQFAIVAIPEPATVAALLGALALLLAIRRRRAVGGA